MGKKMKVKIRDRYSVSDAQEISVDFGEYSFLIIYGQHINGWFIAIPNCMICVEAAHPEDTLYNTDRLAEALKDERKAKILAEAVAKHREETYGY